MRGKFLVVAFALLCTMSLLIAQTIQPTPTVQPTIPAPPTSVNPNPTTVAPNPVAGPAPGPTTSTVATTVPGETTSIMETTTIPGNMGGTGGTGTPNFGTPTTIGPSASASCSTYTLPSATQLNNSINVGIELGILALTVSIDMIAIGYMLSKILPASGIVRWLDNEWVEVTKSALLLAGIYAVLSILGSFAVLLNGGSVGSTYSQNIATLANSANTYLCSVQNNIQFSFGFLISLSNDIGILKSLTIDYAVPIPTPWVVYQAGITFKPYTSNLLFAGLSVSPFDSLLTDLITVISVPVIYITTMEQFLLPYFIGLGLGILIPMGLIFRAFPFVRGIGGTMIAFGIGLAIIFPAVLSIFNQTVSNVLGSSLLIVQAPANWSSTNWFFNVFLQSLNNFLNGLFTYVDTWIIALWGITSVYPALNAIIGFDIYLVIQFLLFILDLAIMFPIMDAIARALGGSIKLQYGKRLKLL